MSRYVWLMAARTLAFLVILLAISAVYHYAEAADEAIPNDKFQPPTDEADWIYCTVTVGDLWKTYVGARSGRHLYVLDNEDGAWDRKSWEKAHHFVSHYCPSELIKIVGMIERIPVSTTPASKRLRQSAPASAIAESKVKQIPRVRRTTALERWCADNLSAPKCRYTHPSMLLINQYFEVSQVRLWPDGRCRHTFPNDDKRFVTNTDLCVAGFREFSWTKNQ